MSIASSRSTIAAAVGGISGLRVFDHMPDSIQEFPALALRLDGANYTDLTHTFRLLIVASVWDESEAQLSLDPYLEPTGAQSIKAALDAFPKCLTVTAGRVERKHVNGVAYTGAELVVVVDDSP